VDLDEQGARCQSLATRSIHEIAKVGRTCSALGWLRRIPSRRENERAVMSSSAKRTGRFATPSASPSQSQRFHPSRDALSNDHSRNDRWMLDSHCRTRHQGRDWYRLRIPPRLHAIMILRRDLSAFYFDVLEGPPLHKAPKSKSAVANRRLKSPAPGRLIAPILSFTSEEILEVICEIRSKRRPGRGDFPDGGLRRAADCFWALGVRRSFRT